MLMKRIVCSAREVSFTATCISLRQQARRYDQAYRKPNEDLEPDESKTR